MEKTLKFIESETGVEVVEYKCKAGHAIIIGEDQGMIITQWAEKHRDCRSAMKISDKFTVKYGGENCIAEYILQHNSNSVFAVYLDSDTVVYSVLGHWNFTDSEPVS